jgi:hypothetical protein
VDRRNGKGSARIFMFTSTHLMRQRRFAPLFATQLLNAFNDNLYKNAMVLFVVYSVYNSPRRKRVQRHRLGRVHPAVLPAFGHVRPACRHARQGADHPHRQGGEIIIMTVGAAGLLLAWQGLLTLSWWRSR